MGKVSIKLAIVSIQPKPEYGVTTQSIVDLGLGRFAPHNVTTGVAPGATAVSNA